MQVKGRRIWALAIAGALLIMLLCLLAGCGTTQSTQTTPGSTQAPDQEAVDQASPDSTQAPGQEQKEQTTPGQDGITPNGEQKADTGKKVEILKNGSFEMGHYGWSPQEGTIVTEDDGNKCMSVKYSWGLYQFLQVHQGQTYEITCQVRQDQEPISTARMCIIFYSKDHKILNERTVDILHIPGTQWEDIPHTTFTVPRGAAFTKLFLLSNGHGSVCFDNISILPVAGDSAEAEKS